MGTRGLVGTLKNGVLKGSYQQYDAYPTGTGVQLQDELKAEMEEQENLIADPDDLFEHLAPLVDKMKYVDASKQPSAADLETYKDILAASLNRKVSTGDDWYAYLRGHQNSLTKRLHAGIATEDSNFVKDSLFCEWAYVFDFDDRKVLILRGFNNREDAQWAHARLSPSQVAAKVKESKKYPPSERSIYYGCRLAMTLTMEEFLKADMKAVEGTIGTQEEGEAA